MLGDGVLSSVTIQKCASSGYGLLYVYYHSSLNSELLLKFLYCIEGICWTCWVHPVDDEHMIGYANTQAVVVWGRKRLPLTPVAQKSMDIGAIWFVTYLRSANNPITHFNCRWAVRSFWHLACYSFFWKPACIFTKHIEKWKLTESVILACTLCIQRVRYVLTFLPLALLLPMSNIGTQSTFKAPVIKDEGSLHSMKKCVGNSKLLHLIFDGKNYFDCLFMSLLNRTVICKQICQWQMPLCPLT